MNTTYQSNTSASRSESGLENFAVVFTDNTGIVTEFAVTDISLSQCVSKCNELIETAFRFEYEYVVYIYPLDSSDVSRDVFRRQYGSAGEYRTLQCAPNEPLTINYIISEWLPSDDDTKLDK